ncbi:tetratricopeptide repeat protein [Opisthorchis viverrini]|uniref:Tetratricopeptide repeat protein n=1 Tax=Opisthorchis viverrini TaxID=6198 RepID=A0A1S8X6V0_OPIVI|nr:tetratricopeptide repeat protein [Opisthorchis viverrini]
MEDSLLPLKLVLLLDRDERHMVARADEAETVYRTALTYQERNPDLNYNLGVVLLESGRRAEGLFYLNNALKYNPEHLPTMFAMASTLTETTDPVERERGKHLLETLAEQRYEFAKVHFALGMLETDLKNFKKAASHYYKTIEVTSILGVHLVGIRQLLSFSRF